MESALRFLPLLAKRDVWPLGEHAPRCAALEAQFHQELAELVLELLDLAVLPPVHEVQNLELPQQLSLLR